MLDSFNGTSAAPPLKLELFSWRSLTSEKDTPSVLQQVEPVPDELQVWSTGEPEQVLAGEPEHIPAGEPEHVLAGEPEHVTGEPEHVPGEPEHIPGEPGVPCASTRPNVKVVRNSFSS